MEVDLMIDTLGAEAQWTVAADAERQGYDGVRSGETRHDPFLSLAVSATRTERLELATAIAVAFGRSPMTVAMQANDLQLYSQGRFVLGLGSQVRPHITKRFSMPWSDPVPRMREFVLAVRAIWRSWETGEPPRFRGEHYTHTLMSPFFDPGPNKYGNPPILISAVGPEMTVAAGEVADGILTHGFTTERYLREATLPLLARGRARGEDAGGSCQVYGLPFVVTGRDEEGMLAAAAAVRAQIAFYASTPSYRPVLELHGWGEVGHELNQMSKQGQWQEMSELIDCEMLDAFAVVAAPDQVAEKLLARFGDIYHRVALYAPYETPDGFWLPIVRQLQAAGGNEGATA